MLSYTEGYFFSFFQKALYIYEITSIDLYENLYEDWQSPQLTGPSELRLAMGEESQVLRKSHWPSLLSVTEKCGLLTEEGKRNSALQSCAGFIAMTQTGLDSSCMCGENLALE